MRPVSRAFRRGFTLIELVISMVVLAVVGASLVQMIMSQGRFMDQQEASRSSRAVSRGSLNRLFAEVRNVEAVGGVELDGPEGAWRLLTDDEVREGLGWPPAAGA